MAEQMPEAHDVSEEIRDIALMELIDELEERDHQRLIEALISLHELIGLFVTAGEVEDRVREEVERQLGPVPRNRLFHRH